MGGYAFYVWGSFGVAAVALAIEPLLLRKRQHDVIDSLRRERSADQQQGKTV
ncbi:MAG: heme exporter protein CcmD [Proteobacteria bacterium]|nr:heme exporter protein CcmD [Pseudomonadota bacterium]